MKKLIACIVAVCLLCGCSVAKEKEVVETTEKIIETTETVFEKSTAETEMRAVWISCYELPSAGEGERAFCSAIAEMFKNIKGFGLNTVFVHVRPFADSVYPSEYFPWSKYACGGEDPGFDPLAVMVNVAKEMSLSFHAWINPFRISLSDDYLLSNSEGSVKRIWKKNKENVVALENGVYFNPTSTEVHSLIYDGVREILENYDVDGIHIDDYFYPLTDEDIDAPAFSKYRQSGGTKELADWRRDNISAFVSGLYTLVKSFGKDKIFSISPAGNIEANESKLFADVKLWLSCSGYADIIIPQLYFGFENSALSFAKAADMWNGAATCESVKVIWGLAPYKCGVEDANAGTGKYEWVNNSDMLSRQLSYVRESKRYDGFALFSYSYIFQQKNNENLKKEMKSLKNML